MTRDPDKFQFDHGEAEREENGEHTLQKGVGENLILDRRQGCRADSESHKIINFL